jgi:hypothetical protein
MSGSPPKANGQVLGAGLNCLAATNKCLANFNKSGMQAKATKKCVADITATDLARHGPPPHHALAALEDRSMSEESNKQCSICFRRYTEFGHPAEPVKSGRCCNACNDLVVIPARLRAMREATVAPPALTAVSAKAPRRRKAKKAGHVPGVGNVKE